MAVSKPSISKDIACNLFLIFLSLKGILVNKISRFGWETALKLQRKRKEDIQAFGDEFMQKNVKELVSFLFICDWMNLP